jgi:hypothetical protein
MLFDRGKFSEFSQSDSQRGPSAFIDRNFQIRYTFLLLGASILGLVVTFIPIYYFINQNYDIFISLAFDNSPQIIENLEREKSWVNLTLLSVFTGLFGFFSVLTFRMTARIIGPLKILRNHLIQISRGHFYIPSIKIRDTDEFHDLVESYNYFYLSFQRNLKRELELLKRISVDQRNRDAYMAWRQMIIDKARQLNDTSVDIRSLGPSENDSEPSSGSPDSRHVS